MTRDPRSIHPSHGPAPPAGPGWEIVYDAAPPVVVWRSWLLVPSTRRSVGGPLLTGMQGYPWLGAQLEAKCLQQVADATVADWATVRVDRHHPSVPAAHCTCGIHAVRDELNTPPHRWIRQPVVSGFVELSGRRVESARGYRSQYGRMVGPLRLRLPDPPPWLGLLSGQPPQPCRVLAGPHRYRVLWRPGRAGTPIHVWEEQMRRGLAARYGVALVVLRPAVESAA